MAQLRATRVAGKGGEAAADSEHLQAPETYVGFLRSDRTLEITFLEPGAEAYAFTFG